jgi:hypothetical protein
MNIRQRSAEDHSDRPAEHETFVYFDTAWRDIKKVFDPIELPGRKPLITLRDAAVYITKLPRAEHHALIGRPRWKRYCWSREHDGPTMMARIGVMQALNHGKPGPVPTPRRKRAKVYKIIRD